MRFLAGECCDAALVAALRAEGHDVLYVQETMRGALDIQVIERAYSEKRILLTEDKDFGEIAIRLRQPVHAVILLRFEVQERSEKIPRLRALLDQEGEKFSENLSC